MCSLRSHSICYPVFPSRELRLIVPKHYQSFADKHCKNKKLNAFNSNEVVSGATQIKIGLERHGIADVVLYFQLCAEASSDQFPQANSAQLFATALSVISPREPEISHVGYIYTKEIGICCKSSLLSSAQESVVHTCTNTLLVQN